MSRLQFVCTLGAPILAFSLISVTAPATEISLSVHFNREEILVTSDRGYDRIGLPEGIYTEAVGAPMLPMKPVKVLIPANATLESVEATGDCVDLDGDFYLLPAQKPDPLLYPYQEREFVFPDEEIYSSARLYPGELVEVNDEGNLAGYRMVSLTLHPVQYVPAERRIRFYDRIDLSVNYRESKDSRVYRRSAKSQELYGRIVRTIVANPQDVEAFSPPVDLITYGGKSAKDEGFEYLIITTSSAVMDDQFQYVADWKTRKGVPAAVRTIEWIGQRYPGRDLQEQIRNYLKVAHTDSGLVYVLLGGDKDIMPIRNVWFWDPDPTDPPYLDTIPSDYYYSCLDGNWDANGNSVFGELVDDVDLLPDVFVGRALVSGGLEVHRIVSPKFLVYEIRPDSSYLIDALFIAESGGEGIKDRVEESFSNQFNVWKWYESGGGDISQSEAVAVYDSGVNIVNHWGTPRTLSILPCTDRAVGLFFTSAPLAGAFDQPEDWGSDHWRACGVVNLVSSTRYSWSDAAEALDYRIFDYLFDGIYNTGATFALAKASCGVPNLSFRWLQYSFGLFGDPEIPIRTCLPLRLSVEHTETRYGDDVEVVVTVEAAGTPLEGARVCLSNSEIRGLRLTDSEGKALWFFPFWDWGRWMHLDPISLVVTYENAAYPYQEVIGYDLVQEQTLPDQKAEAFVTYPNPFTDQTHISYGVPQSSDGMEAVLTVYNISGQVVRHLVKDYRKPGCHQLLWQGDDDQGISLPGGVYFCRFEVGKHSATKKLTLLR